MAKIIGLMSGTSMDGVDAAAFDIVWSGKGPKVSHLGSARASYPSDVKELLETACRGKLPMDRLLELDLEVGRIFGSLGRKLAASMNKQGHLIQLIGSHGQTIRHIPEKAATLQIGAGSVIASVTGLDTWFDFRRADMAAGGQGAPLAPVAHLHLFRHESKDTLALNLGGIANLTHIPKGATQLSSLLAYDTGPGNMLMDLAARRISDMDYDKGGRLAKSGKVNQRLLSIAVSHPYFNKPWPKSTGREAFGEPFIQWLAPKGRLGWNEDLLATLTEFTAVSIVREVEKLSKAGRPADRIILCGGGAKNRFLVNRLSALAAPLEVMSPDKAGVPAGLVECALMAILAYHADKRDLLDLSAITGSKKPVRLGTLAPGR